MSDITQEQIFALIETGIRAPSPENLQPWKFHLVENGFELRMDPGRVGLFCDACYAATKISCGAFIENVATMADALGFATEITRFDTAGGASGNGMRIARLVFEPIAPAMRPEADSVRKMLLDRHTDRNLYRFNRSVPAPLVEELSRCVQHEAGYRLHAYLSREARAAAIRAVTDTDIVRFTSREMHLDLFRVLRFGSEAEETCDGLAEATLGIERFLIPPFRMLAPWPLNRALQYLGLHYLMAWRGTWLPMKSSSLLVSIVQHGKLDFVEGGRIMQRFWVRANQAGLSVQPVGALPLFLARLRCQDGAGFTPRQKEKLFRIERGLADATPGFNPESDHWVMLFRLGFARRPAARSYRRFPVGSFMDIA